MVKRIFYFIITGVLMATLMSALFGCDNVDKRATEPIITQLAAKYGKSFTVNALGDRIDKNTATAYVFADDDPTLMFTARSTANGELVFDNYAYRSVCRKVETITNTSFAKYGINSECFADFATVNNSIKPDTSVEQYIKDNSPASVVVTIIVKTSNSVTGENLEKAYNDFYAQLSGIIVGTGLYVLTEKDFDKIVANVKRETQVFDAYRLKVSGAEDDIKELNIRVTNNGLSLSVAEINAVLTKGVA